MKPIDLAPLLLILASLPGSPRTAVAQERGPGGPEFGRRDEPWRFERRGDPLFDFTVEELPDSLALDRGQKEKLRRLLEDLRPEPREWRPERPLDEPPGEDSTRAAFEPRMSAPQGDRELLRFFAETAGFLHTPQFSGLMRFVAVRRAAVGRGDDARTRDLGQIRLSIARAALPGDTSESVLVLWQAQSLRADSLEMAYALHRAEYAPIRSEIERAWTEWRALAAASLPAEELGRLEARRRTAVETALERELSAREGALSDRFDAYRRALRLKGRVPDAMRSLLDQSIGRRRDVLVGLKSGTTPVEAIEIEDRRAGREAQAEIERLLDPDQTERWRAMMACLDAAPRASASGP